MDHATPRPRSCSRAIEGTPQHDSTRGWILERFETAGSEHMGLIKGRSFLMTIISRPRNRGSPKRELIHVHLLSRRPKIPVGPARPQAAVVLLDEVIPARIAHNRRITALSPCRCIDSTCAGAFGPIVSHKCVPDPCAANAGEASKYVVRHLAQDHWGLELAATVNVLVGHVEVERSGRARKKRHVIVCARRVAAGDSEREKRFTRSEQLGLKRPAGSTRRKPVFEPAPGVGGGGVAASVLRGQRSEQCASRAPPLGGRREPNETM